jgi:hypothetical protein
VENLKKKIDQNSIKLTNPTICIWTIFLITQYNADTHNMHAHKPYPYEHLRRTEYPTYLEIPEVVVNTSLSTGMPLTT